MNDVMRGLALLLIVFTVPAVVTTRDPERQLLSLSFYGLVLALLFFAFEAPDVALSQIVIGAVALPLMVLLALARIRRRSQEGKR